MQINQKDKELVLIGVVMEALPNAFFRIKFEDEKLILTYISGKMRMNHIKVLIGDKVKVQLDPYGGKGRIIQRM